MDTAVSTGRLRAEWVQVTDASGRVRLEQRWRQVEPAPVADTRAGLTTAA